MQLHVAVYVVSVGIAEGAKGGSTLNVLNSPRSCAC